MNDKFTGLPIQRLLQWILAEEKRGEIFGIHETLFFHPREEDPFRIRRYGRLLETPIGVAAGPHTQLAQNIIAAWLTGARYLELKTIQTLDELEVTKPCIDMLDEGYNCEWSQELKLQESFDEYLKAFIILHILKDRFGWGRPDEAGFIFNMSVGYNLEGILAPNVQGFLDKMAACGQEKTAKLDTLAPFFPRVRELTIPDTISDNITISTMHGCPPDEIERIGRYFITERRLHTTIKLNPTLLGPRRLREILNDQLGFESVVPDVAFEHDLQFDAACDLIRALKEAAQEAGVAFNLKLTNTLETSNSGRALPEKEAMVYMSGRALHPVSINLAQRLQEAFRGELDISFSAGADCFNLTPILACGLMPVTVCSDLLKPGGYGRLGQYLEELGRSMQSSGVKTLDDFMLSYSGGNSTSADKAAIRRNLETYAQEVVQQKAFHKESFPYAGIKTERPLTPFDCIAAPCVQTCPLGQEVPAYLRHAAAGEPQKGFQVILATNPFPHLQGMVCDHLCQYKCTRINMDAPVKIRELKRFIAESQTGSRLPQTKPANGSRAAVIGAGPSGLACAWFLAREGFGVDIYEAKGYAGGMAADAIPVFRLDAKALKKDIDRILALGVRIHYKQPIDKEQWEKIKAESDYLYLAVGAQGALSLGLAGEDCENIFDQLSFLGAVRRRQPLDLGREVLIIGGGNAAMDAARTAKRLVGDNGRVTIVYRRTRKEMPAHHEEIEDALAEGVGLLELAAPVGLAVVQNRVREVACMRMQLKDTKEGRPRPFEIPGSRFHLPADSIITAIGQKVVCDFLPDDAGRAEAAPENIAGGKIFVGGDAIRGASTLVRAIADGKKVAEKIIATMTPDEKLESQPTISPIDGGAMARLKARREFGPAFPTRPLDRRKGFDLVVGTMEAAAARQEASRCLACDQLCNVCVSVCPNRANVAYRITPEIYPLARARRSGDLLTVEKSGVLAFSQRDQVLNIDDFCNQCGNCTTFCPTNGAPFQDKPKFYLTLPALAAAQTGYHLAGRCLHAKIDGMIATLTRGDDALQFESDHLHAHLHPKTLAVLSVDHLADGLTEAHLKDAVIMGVLLMGVEKTCIGF